MKDATLDDDVVQHVLTSFALDYEAGRDPDPRLYEARCPSDESRAVFRRALTEYLDLEELLPEREETQRHIGPYQVEDELGRGGMAEVYEVWDSDLNRSLAMKVSSRARLNADGSVPPGHEEQVARFLQEAQITSQLRHPGIVPVHQVGIDSRGHIYFTMQLIERKTLQGIFEARAAGGEECSPTRFLGILLKVCEAVDFAHSQGVIHRDLKPGNVMVGQFGEVYVLDWGLAKFLDRDAAGALGLFLRGNPAGASLVTDPVLEYDLGQSPPSFTRDGVVVGTPAYMSPEQAEDREVGKPADVYSLGAILYEFLTGRAPYHDSGSSLELPRPEAVLERLRQGPPRHVRELAPGAQVELVAICEKAMARDVGERYASVRELKDDLRAFTEDRVVRAYATGAAAELRKWVRRNRGLTGFSVLLAVLAAGALAAYFWLEEQALRREQLAADPALLETQVDRVKTLWPLSAAGAGKMEDWLAMSEALIRRNRELEAESGAEVEFAEALACLLYTSPSPRD